MAGEVQLKLGVSLDLGYFRTEMQKAVNIVNSEFTGRLKVKFDRQILDRELNNLQRAIRRRTYRIEIGGNIDALPDKIKNLQQSLKDLEGFGAGIGVTARAAVTKKDARKIRSDVYRQIVSDGGKILLPVGLAPISQAAADRFRADLLKKIGSLTVKVKADVQGGFAASPLGAAGLEQYMRTQGLSGGNMPSAVQVGRSERLRKALEDLTVKQLQALAKEEGIGGVSKLKKDPLIQKLVTDLQQDTAERILGNIKNQLQNPLDIVARGIFRMLGIDPQSLREKRLPPAINWQATTPERTPPIGPSSTGRLLSGSTAASALPGTSFAQQKRLLGDLVDADLKEILRNAANAFVDSVRAEMNAAVRSVSVRDLGTTIRGAIAPGAPPPSRLMLPAAGGTGGYFGGGRRPGGGFVPESGFPSDGMATGPQGPKNMLSLDYYKNAFKYAEALKIAEASAKNFRASNLPLIGGLQGIAAEFSEATKQVLLYGTAYKGLAFITSLPGQILNAAKSQQQYSNAMQVATQETGTFAKEMLFVDNVQRAFGLNLETTRQGFARLYASMAPAGFDSGSIEKLFTGISAATAALQLTPDKAERVIYAFGQMASKGQAMSEELKGQLGDVLPGALSIFAKAAGKSVKEFNAELEKGVYSGGKFRELMTNVTDELINRFGSGAAAAGRSLQGLLNTLQGDFQRTLESFSPLANAAAQAVLQPIASSLKQLSVSAQIATGEIDRIQGQIKQAQQVVSDLKLGGADSGDIAAAEKNVLALQVRYEALNEALKNPAIAKQVQDIQRFTEELAKAGTFVMNVASAIGSALSPIINVLGTNLTTVISLITSFYVGFQTARLAAMALMGVLLAYKTLSSILGFGPAALSANALASAFNVLGVAATGTKVQVVGLRLALTALVASTVVGLVVAGVMAIAGAFATMRDRAKEAGQSSRDAAKAAVEAANSGNVAMANMQVQTILSESRANKKALETLQKLRDRATPLQREGGFKIELTPEEAAALRGSKLTENLLRETKGGVRQAQLPTNRLMRQLMRDFGSVSGEQAQNLREAKAAQQEALRNEKRLGLNQPTPGTLPPESESEKDTGRRQREAEKLANQKQQLAIDAANYQNRLDQARLQGLIEMDNMAFEHFKRNIDALNDYKLAGLDSIQARQLKYQQDLQKVELERMDTVRKLQVETTKATMEQIAAQRSSLAAGGATGLFQGSTGTSSGPHFDIRKLTGERITEAEARAIFSERVRRQLTMTSGYGPRVAPVRGASTFHRGIDLAGPAGTPLELASGYSLRGTARFEGGLGYTQEVVGPQGQGFKVSHLQKPGASYTRQRKSERQENKAEVEQIQLSNKVLQENVGIRYSSIEAIEKTRALIQQNINTIFPVAEQKLDNELLKERNRLQALGFSSDYISSAITAYKAEKEGAIAVNNAKNNIKQYEDALAKMQEKKSKGIALTQAEKYLYGSADEAIFQLTGQVNAYKEELAGLEKQQKQYNITLQESLQLQADSLISGVQGKIKAATPLGGLGLSAGFIGDAASKYEEAVEMGASQQEASRFAELQNQLTLLETRNNAIRSSILGIGDAFGTAMTAGVASLVDGTSNAQEVFSNFLKTVGQTLLQAAQQMIATYIVIGIARIFAGLGGGGKGGGLNFADMNKYSTEGPISAGMFGVASANGNFLEGGFQAFANGGVVNGPTLGLVGEGNDSEYIIPSAKMSEAMSRYASGIRGAGVIPGNGNVTTGSTPQPSMSLGPIDVRYNVERINSVDYVTADQFQRGMALAAQQGAAQGQRRALAQLQQNTSVRRKLGL